MNCLPSLNLSGLFAYFFLPRKWGSRFYLAGLLRAFDVIVKQVQQGEDLPLLLALAAAIYRRQFSCREVGFHPSWRAQLPETKESPYPGGLTCEGLPKSDLLEGCGLQTLVKPGGVCGASPSSSQGRSPSSYPVLKVSAPGAASMAIMTTGGVHPISLGLESALLPF